MIAFKGKVIVIPDVGIKWLPTALVTIKTNDKKYLCEMLVDSGADITLIPRKFGEQLDFEFKEPEIKEIRGIGEGAVSYCLRKVTLEIGRYAITARIGWALIEEVPFILGRLDVFDKFNVEFKQKEQLTIFRPTYRPT